MPEFTLSVVDQSPMHAGGMAADALKESVELAKAVERYGYSRYWVTEHGFQGMRFSPLYHPDSSWLNSRATKPGSVSSRWSRASAKRTSMDESSGQIVCVKH